MQCVPTVAAMREAPHIHEDDLSLYSEGALARGPSAILACHILHCARCRSSLAEVRELNRLFAAIQARGAGIPKSNGKPNRERLRSCA
jgi:anti-sigma factor RsiW